MRIYTDKYWPRSQESTLRRMLKDTQHDRYLTEMSDFGGAEPNRGRVIRPVERMERLSSPNVI